MLDKKYTKLFSPTLLSPVEGERTKQPQKDHDKEGKIKQHSDFEQRLGKFKRSVQLKRQS